MGRPGLDWPVWLSAELEWILLPLPVSTLRSGGLCQVSASQICLGNWIKEEDECNKRSEYCIWKTYP